jgi:hypothetical protein
MIYKSKLSKEEILGGMIDVLEKENKELKEELKQYTELKRRIFSNLEKVWMYDSSFPLSPKDMGKRAELIEKTFYEIANEWIGDY